MHLRAKNIFIRGGELIVGYKEKPFANKAKITLYGTKEEATLVYDTQVEAGNKLLTNTNLIKMYGKKRKQLMTRLHAPAEKGATSIIVDKDLDLVKDDRIGLATTTFYNYAGDYAIVKEYNKASGEVTLVSPLEYYHWGKNESTVGKYGVDIRGEVVILSRNIIIAGDNIEGWGG